MKTKFTDLNSDTQRIISSFLTLKDNSKLAGASSTLREQLLEGEIVTPPIEARTFLVFESKIHLIKGILKTSPLCIETLHFNEYKSLPQTYKKIREERYSLLKYLPAVAIIFIVLMAVCNDHITCQPIRYSSGIEGEKVIMVGTAMIVLAYAFPRFLDYYFFETRDHSVSLMQLWYELEHGKIPENLFAKAAQLRIDLQQHKKLAVGYQKAGGMDRYYARRGYSGGRLDEAFHVVRAARARETLIAGDALPTL
jgi:hypothetical protein